MERVKIGIVGIGCISGIYLTNFHGLFKDIVEVSAVCDILPERAKAAQEKYHIPKAYFTDEEIMADPEVQVIVNLTPPDQHHPVNEMALLAGKHVYCEKPLAITREGGAALVKLAQAKNLLLGGAPDTFLGGGIQTCRKLIDEGWIGKPVAAQASMLGHGPESWHPDPAFFYHTGAGPMFDMGPYYLTALTYLMGPVKTVTGSARITFPTRRATCEARYGEIIDVEVPTHVVGVLNFESGAIGTLTTSFDVWTDRGASLIIYGERGTLRVPDPNTFGGPVELLRAGQKAWETVPVVHGYRENSRGLGVADMCCALVQGRAPRAHMGQTFHVLDLMCAFHEAAAAAGSVALGSTVVRGPALATDGMEGEVLR